MARKTPTKKYKYQIDKQKYNRQVRRIKKNYEDIESMGGKFSKSLTEIIKPPKKPTEATVRRLKQITKNDLYRLAKTATGEFGWKLRIEREKRSAEKARATRFRTKLAKEKYGEYFDTFSEEDKKEAREIAYDEWYWERHRDEILHGKPEPEPEPEQEIFDDESYETYRDQFTEEIGGSRQYRNSMIDLIRDEIRANDDYDLIRDLGDKFEDMVEEMTDTELQKWVEDYGHNFLDNVKHVIKYRAKETVAKKYYDICVSMLHSGITPLDQFYKDEDFYDKDEAELYKGTWYNVDTGEILDNGRRFKDHTLYRNIDNNAEYKDGQLSWINVPTDKLPKGLRQRDLSIMGYSPSEIEEILDEEYGE